MKMLYELQNIAKVFIGMPLKSGAILDASDSTDDFALTFSISKVGNSESIYLNSSDFVKIKPLKKCDYLQDGDVVICNRNTFYAKIIRETHGAKIMAREYWTIIRPDRDVCEPEFLAMLLNTASVANQLNALALGSGMKTLSVADTKRFKVELPSLQEQRKVMLVYNEIEKARQLYSDKIKMLEKIAKGIVK